MPRGPAPTEAEARQREFRCRSCGAAPGQRCETWSGRKVSRSHIDRYNQALWNGRLPIRGE